MPRSGVLLSYTLQKESLAGFEDQEPMIFGVLKLENDVRLLAQIVDVSYESLKVGMKLKAVFRKVRVDGESGQIFYAYKFGPTLEAEPHKHV